ncbi:hypothetical protein DF186_16425, partial [Enterococcus hirae]
QISKNGEWVGAIIQPPYIEAQNDDKDSLRTGVALLKTSDGETVHFDEVEEFSFSNNGRWALIHHHQSNTVEEGDFKNPHLGKPITVYDLE